MALDPSAAARLALSVSEPVSRRVAKLHAIHQHVLQTAHPPPCSRPCLGGVLSAAAGAPPPRARAGGG
ncbi:hypothetical protein HaLaN_32410, partial [Haematococcus lacustris]